LKRGSYTYFKFLTNTPEPRDIEDGVGAVNHYHVYVFDLPMTALEHTTMTNQFTNEMSRMDLGHVPFRKNYDENDDFKFVSLDTIENIPNLWPMIRTHVIGNPEFRRALDETLWTPFNLRC